MSPNVYFKCLSFPQSSRKHSQGPALARFETPAKKNTLGQLIDKELNRKKMKITLDCFA